MEKQAVLIGLYCFSYRVVLADIEPLILSI